ncbi:hypothetical protein SAMN05421847_0473 [Halpernia humi]|uniref:Uncharacterized protein n=1 Tax=Halpernia humi TaxID=493375 RepID=A0A1H5TH89_9FLAO|nr:hypothetical protein [Halpernia humi]SEF62120.1 hypothetical protein SAMN05421847_0473 [Halpernia humi]
MKTLFFLLIPTLFFAQSKKEIKKIEQKIKNSYYYSFLSDNINLKKTAKFYACLDKYYKDVNIYEDKPFLNKKEFLKKYPEYFSKDGKEERNLNQYHYDKYYEFASMMQLAYMHEQFDENGKSITFPKCIKSEF